MSVKSVRSVKNVGKVCNTMMLMMAVSSMSAVDIMDKWDHKDGGRASIFASALSTAMGVGITIQGQHPAFIPSFSSSFTSRSSHSSSPLCLPQLLDESHWLALETPCEPPSCSAMNE